VTAAPTGAPRVGLTLRTAPAPGDSLPPCGGEMGSVQYGTAVPPRTTPIPSPQGGGVEIAKPANRIVPPVTGRLPPEPRP
jgi:hypothetical protein